ncbi:MAG: PAS domain S-box protein [Nitrospirae bacterium]|nr:PAS domain S-box protein [Nitrospirota bacterium]
MSKSKILVVEDEWIIADDIKKSLQNLGYGISAVVATGEEAIKKAEEKRPELVLMDVVLQGEISGIEAAGIIISRYDIPVIFLTAYADNEIIGQAKKTKAHGYIVKPFNERELQATIDLALYKHKMEIKLKESENRLSTILRSIGDAVISTDKEGAVIFMNPVAQALTGCKMNDVNGRHLQDVLKIKADGSSGAFEGTISEIIQEGKTVNQVKVILSTDNNGMWIELSSAPSVDDKRRINGAVIVFRDITERIRSEIELEKYRKELEHLAEERQEKYSNLFHHSSDAILIHDLEGVILDVNQKALEQFGYSRSEMLSMKIPELFLLEDLEKSKGACDAIIQNGLANFEIEFKKKYSAVFSAEVSASLLDISGNKVIQCIIRDISERKKAENELMKHREKLEELIRERTFELLEANENLKVEVSVRKQAEKKLLSYQKQLQSLTSQISLIEEHEKRRIATELHDRIGQTLALSKIKLGLLNKAVQAVEFKDIIREVLQLIEQTIKETRTLTFELSPPILYELGLSQAVQWLIDQFRDKHGITIKYEYEDGDMSFDNNTRFFLFQAVRELLINIVKHAHAGKVKIRMSRDTNKLKIIVEDNGVGFFDSSLTYNGYGLFNIRERMNHIGGHFEIKSTPGRGTRVTLVAPFQVPIKSA